MKPSFRMLLAESLNQFWDARQPRERQYLQVAAGFVVLTLIYLLAIDPAWTGREELSRSLPQLHQQAAEMQQYAQQLAAIPGTENRHEVTRELIDAGMTHNGLKSQSLSVSDGVVRVQISSASMVSLQTWLLEVQKSSALFVEDIKIIGLEQGLISVNLVLRQVNSGN